MWIACLIALIPPFTPPKSHTPHQLIVNIYFPYFHLLPGFTVVCLITPWALLSVSPSSVFFLRQLSVKCRQMAVYIEPEIWEWNCASLPILPISYTWFPLNASYSYINLESNWDGEKENAFEVRRTQLFFSVSLTQLQMYATPILILNIMH